MRVHSIFNSIDGEVNCHGQGTFTTFVRTSGCNLRCRWCDTKYAFDRSPAMHLDVILNKLEEIGCPKVTITGGEPLMQGNYFVDAVEAIADAGYSITVETNGTFPIVVDHLIDGWIMDYKLPSANVNDTLTKDRHFMDLHPQDFIKFVIRDHDDFVEAGKVIQRFERIGVTAQYAMSPLMDCPGSVDARELITWMKESYMWEVKFNAQIHKLLNLKEDS